MHTGTGHPELRQGRAAELATHTVQVPQVLHTKAAVGWVTVTVTLDPDGGS